MADDLIMNNARMNDPRTELICARLYLRTGKRQLRAGSPAVAVAAMYDAVLFGMRYYIAKHKSCAEFVSTSHPWDAASLFHALARAGVFEDPLTLNRLSLIVERALWQGSLSFDATSTLMEVETMLTKLGVLPIHASASPGGQSWHKKL